MRFFRQTKDRLNASEQATESDVMADAVPTKTPRPHRLWIWLLTPCAAILLEYAYSRVLPCEVQYTYYRHGAISSRTEVDPSGRPHGRQVHFDPDGHICSEVIFEHGVWSSCTQFDRVLREMHKTLPAATPPYWQLSSAPMPDFYWNYRCTESRPMARGGERRADNNDCAAHPADRESTR
jgi:hypothetical protein